MPADSMTPVAAPLAQPCFIAGSGSGNERPLFAWHHPAVPTARRGAGIVLCPALGYEYMSAYRTWRLLAERLAALGFDTLRIDYDGTGNSAGGALDPGRVDAWLSSIARAAAEVRRLSGSDRVALVGLRLGALLALQAAADHGVDRLVLWSPFPSGRACLRELRALARLGVQDDPLEDACEPAINAEGHLFAADTVAALSKWTIGSVTTQPAPEVLLVERDDRPIDSTVEAHLQTFGTRVDRMRVGGTAEMLLPPHLSQVPEHALDGIETWFRDWQPVPGTASGRPAPRQPVARAAASGDGERAVRFGPGERLFGVLACRHESSANPAVILFNTGAGHHVGPHRLYVPLARQWVDRGHLVLRFDLGGIGDSAPPPGARDNAVYPTHMLDDAREAIAFVRREAPHRQVIVAGICSGGWLAFEAARHGLAVDGIVAINAPLYLRDAGTAWPSEGRTLDRYRQSVRDPAKWMKALSGGASYATFSRVAARAVVRRVTVRVSGALGEALPDGLASDLCSIAGRRIRSLFVFSRGDNGLAYFQLYAEPALRRSGVREFVRQVVVENAGHVFRPRAAQHALSTILSDFLATPVNGKR
jgi:alpha-beta hydrolase superfamily lysophospholipase